MERKIPPEAFDVYFELGPGRSYQAVADHFGVSKQAITRRAVDEDWQGRLTKLEAEARTKRDAKLVESAEQRAERHLKMVRAGQGKCIEGMREHRLKSAKDAIDGLERMIKLERTILGEPAERSEVSVEQILRDEWNRWMLKPGEKEDWSALEGGDAKPADN